MCFPTYGNFLISTSHFNWWLHLFGWTWWPANRYEAFGHRCMVQLGMDGLLDLAIVVASFQGRFSGRPKWGPWGLTCRTDDTSTIRQKPKCQRFLRDWLMMLYIYIISDLTWCPGWGHVNTIVPERCQFIYLFFVPAEGGLGRDGPMFSCCLYSWVVRRWKREDKLESWFKMIQTP